jgi:uncharacterized membrane protein
MLGGHDLSHVRAVWLVASAFGAAALVVLVVLYRRARSRAELDEAEAILADDDRS